MYAPITTLAVSEGIETALAIRFATGLPVWAALCADGMRDLCLPGKPLDLLIVFGDNDSHRVGQQAAEHLAARALNAGIRVQKIVLVTADQDWADVLKENSLDR